MGLTRRAFNQSLFAKAAFAALPASVLRAAAAVGGGAAREALALGHGKAYPEALIDHVAPQTGGEVHFAPIASLADVRKIKLPFHAHSIVWHPTDPDVAYAIHKLGAQTAAVDLKRGRLLRLIDAGPKTRFFGHGVSANGKTYVSAMDDAAGKGVLLVLNERFAVEGRIETRGAYPHDCKWVPEENSLIVLNLRPKKMTLTERNRIRSDAECQSLFVYLDPSSGEAKKTKPLGNRSGEFGHFDRLPDGRLIAAGNELEDKLLGGVKARANLGRAVLVEADGRTRVLDVPKGAPYPKGLPTSVVAGPEAVAVTFTVSGQIGFWRRPNLEPIAVLPLAGARGAIWAPELGAFIGSGDAQTKVYKIGEAGAARAVEEIEAPFVGFGAHIQRGKLV